MNILDLSGLWQCEIPGQQAPVRIPGTLDESGIGQMDDPARQWKADEVQRIGFWQPGDPIVTRLTRKVSYEGAARISRTVTWDLPEGMRIFADVERARHLQLLVNGKKAPLYRPGSVSTPWVFELTGLVTGRDEFTWISDNSYPGWPRDAIVYSSAASDETQTNWNGLLGYVRLRMERESFISAVRVYPRGDTVDVQIALDVPRGWNSPVTLRCDAFAIDHTELLHCQPGQQVWRRTGIPLRPDAKKWDLEEGSLHTLTVSCPGLEDRTVSFGIRDFAAQNGHLTLNGRNIFIRGEANCAVFPETGYPPMDAEKWAEVLGSYRAYGVNCMRFHSHCPPEAAFTAADRIGMLMQPELSHWDPNHAFAVPEARDYYRTELEQILLQLSNHPSFVMLTFGNELQADAAGHAYMDDMLALAHRMDPTRLFANGSNPHYGGLGPDPASDFYTSTDVPGHHLRATSAEFRGWLNRQYPDWRVNYDDGVGAIREKTDQPVFTFEVGQYEVLPDFREIGDYQGVTRPDNLAFVQKKVRSAGMEADWQRRVEATGELSLLCYRAEVEAALRTAGYSGISLLGLQDFPGQGTALVGMMNAHLHPKPYDFARPERFRAFFRDVLPLALLPRFTYVCGEQADIPLRMANYGKSALSGQPAWTLKGDGVSLAGVLPAVEARPGGLTDLGTLALAMPALARPSRLTLTLAFSGAENAYSLWVYPDEAAVCPDTVYPCRSLDDQALAVLAAGGRVLLEPDLGAAPVHSIPTQFSTDFWSVCTFPGQAGSMGMLIDQQHPLFRLFPTDSHTDWQWWPMAVQRALILPEPLHNPIITEMDSYAFMRPMVKLFECTCGGGRLMVSSMGLRDLQMYPEARALLRAIYVYMASGAFQPRQELSAAWVQELVK